MVSVRDIAMEHWTKYGRNFFRWAKAAIVFSPCVVLPTGVGEKLEAMTLRTLTFKFTSKHNNGVETIGLFVNQERSTCWSVASHLDF